jgi:hypothetical protein
VSRKAMLALALAAALIAVTSASAGAFATWRVIGKASASGSFAIASANGEAKRPLALRVRSLGAAPADITAILSCTREANLRTGQVITLGVRGSDSCSVIASGSADGKVSLRIEALR